MGAISQKGAEFLLRSRLADAEAGDVDALFELGVSYSTGRGAPVDLIEAHKWFNLAALSGCTRGQECRAEIALEMTAREIAGAPHEYLGRTAKPGRLCGKHRLRRGTENDALVSEIDHRPAALRGEIGAQRVDAQKRRLNRLALGQEWKLRLRTAGGEQDSTGEWKLAHQSCGPDQSGSD